jgi:hypothetical protein
MKEDYTTYEASKKKARSPIVTRKKKDSSKVRNPSSIEEVMDLKVSGEGHSMKQKSSPGVTSIPFKFNSARIFRINHIFDFIKKEEKK